MKIIKLTLALVFLVLHGTFAQEKLNVDISKSIINWTGHAEIGSYAPTGTLQIKNGSVTVSRNVIIGADIVIDMRSLKNDNADLTKHLKDKEFFDVEKYPVGRIVIKSVRKDQAFGTLTVKNKTGKLSFPVTITKHHNGFIISGSAIIDRTKFGIVYNSSSFFANLGDKAIRNTFDVAFTIAVAKPAD